MIWSLIELLSWISLWTTGPQQVTRVHSFLLVYAKVGRALLALQWWLLRKVKGWCAEAFGREEPGRPYGFNR